MIPILVAIAIGVTLTALAAAWKVRRKLQPGVLAQRRLVLEELSAGTLIGPLLHRLAQQGWRIDGARSAHAEGFEHVLKRDHEVGLLGLRRGKQANLEPHQLDQLIDIAKTWGANRIWLICTGKASRGEDRGTDAAMLTLIEVDELWRMHADLLPAGARTPADRAQRRLLAAAIGTAVGVLLCGGLLVWAVQAPWGSSEVASNKVAVPDEQAFSTPEPVSEPSANAATEPPSSDREAADRPATGEQQVSTASSSPEIGAGAPAEENAESEFASAIPNLPARKQFAHEVTALPAVRRAGWASTSTLVIHLHPGHRVEEIADLTCAMAARNPDLGALRLQLLQPAQDEQDSPPRWRLCR